MLGDAGYQVRDEHTHLLLRVCEAINATLLPMGDFRAGILKPISGLRSAMVNGRAHIILKTLDMRGTIRWYTASGFELRDQFPSSEPTWCELMRGDLVIQFLAGDTPWPGHADDDRLSLCLLTERRRRSR